MDLKEIKSEVRFWAIFNIAVPFCVLFIIWAYGVIYAQDELAFYKIFSGADLILASALLSIGVFIDSFSKLDNDNSEDRRLRKKSLYLVIAAIFFLILYGLLKAASFSFYFPADASESLSLEIHMSILASFLSYSLASLQVINMKLEIFKMEVSV